MAKVNYKNLVKLYEQLGIDQANEHLRESFAAKAASPRDIDFGGLFAECFGWHEFHSCRSDRSHFATGVMEAAGAVSTASFQQISNQTVYALIMEAYQSEEFVVTKLIPTRQTMFHFEKVAGITELGDEVVVVNEGDSYPRAGVSETFLNLPELRKRGVAVELTREAIFFDRTGVLQERCSAVGKAGGQNREKRAIDCVIDENAGAVSAVLGGHRYHYRGTSISTYGNSSGSHDWDNLSASTALVDWTDLDAVEQLLNAMTDPDTAEPIVLFGKHLVCAKELEYTALRIRNATEITVTTPGYATTGNPTETKVSNPFGGRFDVVTSRYIASRLGTDTSWFYGDLGKAFVYQEAWAPEVKSLGGNTQVEFDRDIVQQHKFSELGAYGTMEPRAMIAATA